MPNLSETQVIKIAEIGIAERKMTFDHEEGLKARFDGAEKLREGQIASVWTVSYLTEKNPYFDQDLHFVLIDDESAEILYIITPTTYVE